MGDTVHSVKKRGGSKTPSLVSRLPNNLHAKLCKKSVHILYLYFAKHLLLSIFLFCRKLMNCPQEGLLGAFPFTVRTSIMLCWKSMQGLRLSSPFIEEAHMSMCYSAQLEKLVDILLA